MGFFRYVWRIAAVAFSHSLSIAQDVIFGTVIVLEFIVYLAPGPHIGIDFGQWSLAMSAWQIAAIVAAIIFGLRLILAPYWIYQEQQATIVAQRTQLESQTTHQNTQHRAIEIEFQPIEPFLRKRTFPAGNSRFEAYLKIKNCGNGFISELVISIVEISPQPDNKIYTILTPQDRLPRGEFKYVLVAGFNELPLNDGQAALPAFRSSCELIKRLCVAQRFEAGPGLRDIGECLVVVTVSAIRHPTTISAATRTLVPSYNICPFRRTRSARANLSSQGSFGSGAGGLCR
jgi:hypothetical protein